MNSKKVGSLLIIIAIFLMAIYFDYSSIKNSVPDSEHTLKPKTSNGSQSILLHSYNFEDNVIGQNPVGETLSIQEAPEDGTVIIANLGDVQQNHAEIHKSGGSHRVWLKDDLSYDDTYPSGELHFRAYHDASGFGVPLFSASNERVIDMVWWQGKITNGLPGEYITDYPLNQWVDVVIYFDINVGWMFDLNGVRYGDGYSLSFNEPSTGGIAYIHWGSFASGGGYGYMRVDDIAFYYKYETPLKHLHSYDFEEDLIGQDPAGITLIVNDPAEGGSINVDNIGDEQQNHVKLEKFYSYKAIYLRDNLLYYGEEYFAGEYHFKFRSDGGLFQIRLVGSSGCLIALDLWEGNVGRYQYYSWEHHLIYTSYTIKQWTELIIYYNIGLGWMFEIDGVRFGGEYKKSFEHDNPSGLGYISWQASNPWWTGTLRLDDIAFYYYEHSLVSKMWNYSTGEGISSSPALGDVNGDGKLDVIVGSDDHKVYALDGGDGTEIWSYSTTNQVRSSPALGDIDGDGKLEVVLGGVDYNIYALNIEDGSFLWSYPTNGYVHSSPALGDVDGDGKLEVVVGSYDKNVYALNGEDGNLLWNYRADDWIHSSPALGDVDRDGRLEIVVGSGDGNVYMLSGMEGNKIWSFSTGAFIYSSPALGDLDGDGKLDVVIGSDNGNVYMLNGEDGTKSWSFPTGANVLSSPAIGDVDSDGQVEVIVGSSSNHVYSLNAEDGSLEWSALSGAYIYSSPALGDVDADEGLEVVIGSFDNNVYLLDGEDGSEVWSFATGEAVRFSSPALGDVDGDNKLEVVVGSDDGNIYMLRSSPSGEQIKWQGLAGENFYRAKCSSDLSILKPDFTTSQRGVTIGITEITAYITNLGINYDGNILVRFYDEFQGSRTQIGTDQIIDGLSKFEMQTVSIDWIPILFHNITVFIDPENSIEEIHEDNNRDYFYYDKTLSKIPIVDNNNGIINLKLIGDGIISSETNPNSLIERFDEYERIYHIPNYDYTTVGVNIFPQYYAKDTLISGPLTIQSGTSCDLPLDWVNNQYISDIETNFSAEYTTKRGGHIKHALTWDAKGGSRTYHYNCEIPKFQDNDYSTSGSQKVLREATVPGIGVWTHVETVVEVGLEIINGKWNFAWDLEEIELWWALRTHLKYGVGYVYDTIADNLAGDNSFRIDIMAKNTEDEIYHIPIIYYFPSYPVGAANIPGYIGKLGDFVYGYHLNFAFDEISLRDAHRYSERENDWYGSNGGKNPVITIRFRAASGTSLLWDVARACLDIRECSAKFKFRSHTNDQQKLVDPFHDFYTSAPYQENISYGNFQEKTSGWTDRAPINSNNRIISFKTDFYNLYDNINISIDYIKVRYYQFNPSTRSHLKINGALINRRSSSWNFYVDHNLLYEALGTLGFINVSTLALTYEQWDSGWEYNDSIVFAFQIDLSFTFEDIIPYYDSHGEYLYDLGFWERDIRINWKEIQLEGVFIEEIYINDIFQSPWRFFLDYHKENIKICKTWQHLSHTWPEGSSYEAIKLEFKTIEYNTVSGSNIEITDEMTGVNITFSEVSGMGMTSIEKSEEEPDPPSGFEIAGEYYEISTDASFSGTISIAFPYDESKVIGDEENLKIWHWEPSTGWIDITTGIDTVKNVIYGEFTSFSTFIVLEKVEHEYIAWEIDQLIENIQESPDDCWQESGNKNAILNKLNELKNLVLSNELAEAYDKLLHDIKPKLTGLKTDENEEPWGNGIFKNPWVSCPECQEEFCSICNQILEHLSVLYSSLEVGTFNAYASIQIMRLSSFLIGLLAIAVTHYLKLKRKLNPFLKF